MLASSSPPQDLDRLDWPASGLSSRTRAIVVAAAEALFADEDEEGRLVAAPKAVCERAVSSFDRAVGRTSSDLRRGIAVLSFALEWLPLFIIGTPRRMSRLTIDARVRYLEALEQSRIGLVSMLFVAFKVPLSLPAFEEGEELRMTGFDRESTVARRRLPTLSVSDKEADASEEARG